MEKIKVSGTFELMEYLYKNDCIYLFGDIIYNRDGKEFLIVSKLDECDYCFDELDYMVENYGIKLEYGKRYYDGLGWVCKVKDNLYYVNML